MEQKENIKLLDRDGIKPKYKQQVYKEKNIEKSLPKSKGFSNADELKKIRFKDKYKKTKLISKFATKTAIKSAQSVASSIVATADFQQNKDMSMAQLSMQAQNKITEKTKQFFKNKAMNKAKKIAKMGAKKSVVATTKATYKTAKFAVKQTAIATAKLVKVGIATLGAGGFLVCFLLVFAIVATFIATQPQSTGQISSEEAQYWIDNLPADIDPNRAKVVITACSLVGKVPYFWGGKYPQIGECPEWNTPKKVTASGNKNTGKIIPYGLDCSGFIDWVFINASQNLKANAIIGEGARQQYNNCEPLPWNEAQIGDLVFYTDLGHVGIIIGFEGESPVICHENGGSDNVAITDIQNFQLVGRPSYEMFE
jgi:cell wall-associated NlpC family hydrolase